MGVLVAKRYPAAILERLADHTYVECGGGGRAWGCWGGKAGGTALRRGSGSTKRADAIAGTNEKAGIKCYAVSGVCHQSANRILFPARITVRGARGYAISEALFGPYGRVGFWPCRSVFNRSPSVQGDLLECSLLQDDVRVLDEQEEVTSDTAVEGEGDYLRRVIDLYRKAETSPRAYRTFGAEGDRAVPTLAALASAQSLQLQLFELMAMFRLGPLYTRSGRSLMVLRHLAEERIVELQREYASSRIAPKQYAAEFESISEAFQLDLRSALPPAQFERLLDQTPEEPPMRLIDPAII